VPATPANTITPRREIKNYQVKALINLRYVALGQHPTPVTLTIEATDNTDSHVTVFYTHDGSLPDEQSPSFQDNQQFDLAAPGNHVITCYAKDNTGNESYNVFHYSIRP
jgi:hypothetical protein